MKLIIFLAITAAIVLHDVAFAQLKQDQGAGSVSGSIKGANSAYDKSDSRTVVFKGWLKFFSFFPNFKTINRPTKFEYNQAFYDQFSFGKNASFTDKDKDDFGWFDIPDDTHYFFVLSPSTLYAVTARRNDVAKTYKSLELAWLEDTQADSVTGEYKGGMEDLGNYKEGFCFRLKSKTAIAWDICADSLELKKRWMEEIMVVYPPPLAGRGMSSIYDQEITLPINFAENPKPPMPDLGKGHDLITRNGSRTDGRWAILQDWSQCTQACGGGKQYLQRMCIPPQNGGQTCQGPTILTRECNTMPCPNVLTQEVNGPQLPTVMKFHRVSDRPQRYEVCIVKEGDLDLMLEMPGYARSPRFPVRVVLNNKTITVFTTPSYDSVYKSFDLQYSENLINAEDKDQCFNIQDKRDPVNKRVALCIMPMALKAKESVSKAKDTWLHDIDFFKTKCHTKDKYVNVVSPLLNRKRMEVDLEEESEKFQRVKDQEEDRKEKILEGRVETTAQVAMQAVEKEMKFEQLALKEELQREKDDDNDLGRELETEKTKEECLERELKKKEKAKALEKQTMELAAKINDIQQQASLQVQTARSKTMDRIDALRRSASRRRRDQKRQIQEMRTKMAGNLMQEDKSGNVTNCNPERSEASRKEYCDTNFLDFPQKQQDCMLSKMDYCYVCCEHEFGRLHEELREKCYAKCDETLKMGPASGEAKGMWTYVPSSNKLEEK